MYDTGSERNAPLISTAEARVLLADYGVIPKSWAPDETDAEFDTGEKDLQGEIDDDMEREPAPPQPQDMQARVKTSKLKLLKDEIKEGQYIWRCAEEFPTEPIVQYSWPGNTMLKLWDRAEEILERSVWQGASV
jgi:hypothetical protein